MLKNVILDAKIHENFAKIRRNFDKILTKFCCSGLRGSLRGSALGEHGRRRGLGRAPPVAAGRLGLPAFAPGGRKGAGGFRRFRRVTQDRAEVTWCHT